jgi:predicted nucleotidyltransferase
MNTLNESLLDEITERLVAEFEPEQVILFGSQAWGTPKEDSDIDLLVIVFQSNERPISRCRRALACLKDLPLATDVLVKTRAEVDLFRDVYASLECQALEHGKVLHDHRKAASHPVVAHHKDSREVQALVPSGAQCRSFD